MNHPIGTTLEVVLNFTGDVTSPTGTLYVNGSSVGTVVTLSTTGDQVVASCSTTGRSVGDRLYLSVAGTVGGGSETQRSAQRTMDDPMRGTEGANTAAPLDAAGTRSAVGLTSDNLASIINDCAQGSVWTGARAAKLDRDLAAVADIPTVVEIEGALLNEGDGQQLIDAILQVINSNLDVPALELAAIAAQVRTELTTELARIDVATSTRSSHSAADVWTAGTRTLTAFGFSVDLNADQSGVTIGTTTTVTNGVSLADNAITSDKYDESTAFPLVSADSGSTQVARTGADSDTLETLSDQIDGVSAGSDSSLLQSTTIATLASQTSFTLTAGSADDDAYNDRLVVLVDQSTSTQKAVGVVSDYTGSTKTVTLKAAPAFTIATGDTINVLATGDDNAADIDTLLARTAGAISVTVSSPVASDGTVTLYAGDDYNSTTGQLEVVLSNYTGPSPTGATYELRVASTEGFNAGDSTDVITGITASGTLDGTTLTIPFDLDAAETALLTDENPPKRPWNYQYQVIWTKSGDERTVVDAAMTAKQRIGSGS